MRKIVVLIVAFMALYGGYWVVGSRAVLSGVTAALEQLRAEDRVNYASVGLAGFPSRFDLTVEEPEVKGDGVDWAAPFLQVFALSYRPNQIIAVWPHEQTLTIGGQRIDLTSEDMRASALFGAATDLPLDHAQMVIMAPAVRAGAVAAVSAHEARLASQSVAEDGRTHRVGLEITNVMLPPSGALALPGTVERIWLDGTLGFDRPVNRFAGDAPPRLTQAVITGARVQWGPMQIEAKGTIDVDAAGQPEGQITITATEWRRMLDAATKLGFLAPQEAANIERMLDGVARSAPDPDRVSLPFDFRGGQVYLGPFPLGQSPRF